MDPITHFCSGIVAKNYLTKKRDFKTTFIFGLVSMSPDIDNFIGLFGNPFLYLLHHRGFTHSFLGGFILAILLYLIAKVIKYQDEKLLKNFYILILIHIFLDVMTNYGTQIFLPFSAKRVGFDAMFIIDPIYLIILIIFYFISRNAKRTILITSFSLIFAYPITSLAIKTFYQISFKNNKITVTTAPFSPIFWKVIEDRVDQNVMYLSYSPDKKFYYNKPNQEVFALLKNNCDLRIFKWFLKYPYMTIKNENGKTEYAIADLRFEFPFRKNPFVLYLTEDEDSIIYTFRNYSNQAKNNGGDCPTVKILLVKPHGNKECITFPLNHEIYNCTLCK